MMDKEQGLYIQEKAQDVAVTTDKICKAASGKPLSAELLAETLAGDIPDLTEAQLAEQMEQLQAGVRAGRRQFEEISKLSPDELMEEISEKLNQLLEGMSEEQKHQLLILLYQTLCEETGIQVESDMAVYISNLPTEQLMDEVVSLMEKEGDFFIGDLTQVLDDELGLQEGAAALLAEDSEHTEEEKNWILAASVYAEAEKSGEEIMDVRQLGEQVGYECSFLEKFGDVMRTKLLPGGIALVAAAGVGIASVLLIKCVLAAPFAAYFFSFFSAQSWRMLQMVTVGAIIQAMGYTGDAVYMKMLQQKGMGIAEDARLALERYAARIRSDSLEYIALSEKAVEAEKMARLPEETEQEEEMEEEDEFE